MSIERAGNRTTRGDISLEIITKNMVVNAVRAAYKKSKEKLTKTMATPDTTV